MWCNYGGAIDSPCECEHNNPDSLDARLFPSVVFAVAPGVTMDEASSVGEGGEGAAKMRLDGSVCGGMYEQALVSL